MRSILLFAAALTVLGCSELSKPQQKGMTPALHDPYFPIETGKHGGVACKECHAGGKSFRQFTCLTCHEHNEDDMNAVHNRVESYEYVSNSCYSCHPRGDLDLDVDHTQFYPIGPNDTHGGRASPAIGCSDCHLSRTDRTQITCTTCHDANADVPDPKPHAEDLMAQSHDGIPDYQYETRACLTCHENGNPTPGINHEEFFPIGPGDTHGGQASPAIGCADCHIDPNDRSVIGCITCHENNASVPDPKPHAESLMAQKHNGIPGYQYASASCLTCHEGGGITTVNHDEFFPINPGDDHASPPIGCAECHINSADRSVIGCIGCHEHDQAPTNQAHSGVPNYSWTSTACLSCHPNGDVLNNVEHGQYFPIAAGSDHDEISCGACHLDNSDYTVNACFECHNQREDIIGEHAGVDDVNGGTRSAECKLCHADSQVYRQQGHASETPLGSFFITQGKHRREECLDCHVVENGPGQTSPARRNDKPWAADFDKFTCIGCHEHDDRSSLDRKHRGYGDYSFSSVACRSCHRRGR